MFQISKHIKNEAEEILSAGAPLPQQIKSAPAFYVAEGTDKSILAFASLTHNGKSFKIGTKN